MPAISQKLRVQNILYDTANLTVGQATRFPTVIFSFQLVNGAPIIATLHRRFNRDNFYVSMITLEEDWTYGIAIDKERYKQVYFKSKRRLPDANCLHGVAVRSRDPNC